MGAVSIIALSGVPVSWLLWQRPPSIPVLTVVCRATFLLRPGEAVLAPEQEILAVADRPYPDGGSRGLYAPSDLVPLKPRADVVLVGSAFAPGGQPARSLFARIAVGEVDKRIEIFADRHFDLQGTLREGPRFTAMPLVYERAAGGPDTANPIGVRPDARDTYGHLVVPNLQPPGFEISSPSDPIAPIGFGPIASGWPARTALLGPTVGARPLAEWNGQLVPADLDPAYFNTAPRDQQLQALREDERIALESLHPNHPELITRLPGSRPRVFVESGAATPHAVAMRADTLWIDTTRALMTMTWRGQLLLEHLQQSVRVIVAMEQPGHPLSWDDVERLRRPASGVTPAPAHLTQTMDFTALVNLARPTLPFAPISGQPALPAHHAEGGLPFRIAGAPAPSLQPAPAPSTEGDTVDEPLGRITVLLPLVASAAVAPEVALQPPAPAGSPWAHGGAVAVATVAPVMPEPVVAVQIAPAAPPVVAAVQPAPAPARAGAVDALCLVGFDPDVLPRLRKDARFVPLLDALAEQPLDPDLDHPEPGDPAADMEERREMFEILARGAAIGEEGIVAALAGAVRDDGRLIHPIVLVAGEIRFAFDELEALKATSSAAAPHAGADLDAKRILELAREFLGTPGLPAAAAVAEGLTTRVRDTFEKRSLVPAGYFDAQAERALLGGRLFLRRGLFGGPHVRALFHTGSDRPPIPVYLAEELAAGLPATQRVRVRMLAHAHPAADQHETHAVALRAAAIAILITPMLRR